MKRKKRTHVVKGNGPPCPRCHRPMLVYEHKTIGEKQRRQPFYYSRWYRCDNGGCRTSLVMPKQFIVWNNNPKADEMRRLSAIREQLTPRS